VAAPQSWWGRLDAAGRWLENALLVLLFGAILVLSSAQILLRNGFASGLPWADPLVRLLVLWLAVVGAVAASRDRKHIAIEIVTRSLPPFPRRLVTAFVNAFASAVAAFFAWQAWRFVQDSKSFGDLLLGSWPAWMLQTILPVGFGLIAYRYLVRAARALGSGD
jgi:TRAP-type C4-dicarboxylate transport system permease small subunit